MPREGFYKAGALNAGAEEEDGGHIWVSSCRAEQRLGIALPFRFSLPAPSSRLFLPPGHSVTAHWISSPGVQRSHWRWRHASRLTPLTAPGWEVSLAKEGGACRQGHSYSAPNSRCPGGAPGGQLQKDQGAVFSAPYHSACNKVDAQYQLNE